MRLSRGSGREIRPAMAERAQMLAASRRRWQLRLILLLPRGVGSLVNGHTPATYPSSTQLSHGRSPERCCDRAGPDLKLYKTPKPH
ncbi:hypothetical protein VTO73DRAFT_4374 [Trametes versicolor]